MKLLRRNDAASLRRLAKDRPAARSICSTVATEPPLSRRRGPSEALDLGTEHPSGDLLSGHLSLAAPGEVAMSELEFQRELSPDQLARAMSLLNGLAGASIPDPRSAEEPRSQADRANADAAGQVQLVAPPAPRHRSKHLNRAALRFCGLAVAAAAALALLSWSELAPPRPSGPEIAQRQPPARPATATAMADTVSKARPVAEGAAEAATAAAVGNGQPVRQKPRGTQRKTRKAQVATRNKPFERHDWRARASAYSGECFFALCPPGQARRVVYEPPRNDIH
jgi:hypothetical protein